MLQWVLVLPPKYKYPRQRKVNSLNSAHPAPLSVSEPFIMGCEAMSQGKAALFALAGAHGWLA